MFSQHPAWVYCASKPIESVAYCLSKVFPSTHYPQMTSLLQFTVRQVTETEARFTSVERISYYIRSVPSEAELEIPDKKPASNWPDGGAIRLSGIKVTTAGMLLNQGSFLLEMHTSHNHEKGLPVFDPYLVFFSTVTRFTLFHSLWRVHTYEASISITTIVFRRVINTSTKTQTHSV